MKCYNGIATQGGIVPCQQCMPCRINKGRVWTARILMEQATTPFYCWFVTLTYNDENLPTTADGVSTLRKKALRHWIKVQRRRFRFRYYAVGEYGDVSKRPHFHLAVFPQEDFDIAALCATWRHGFSSFSEMQGKRARYLAQYTTKKLTAHDDKRLERDQEPEFRISSTCPGLGAAFASLVARQYRSPAGQKIIEERGDVERTFRIDGKVYPLGNYVLARVRDELQIPLLHRERLCHEGYSEWHQIEEAEMDGEKFVDLEIILKAEQGRRRNAGAKV